MYTHILEDIGFTNAEIKVYLSLLELGSSTAGPIIERSGLQSSVVHATLNNLIQKGFVSFVKEGKRNHYQASSPRHITNYLMEKKERFEQVLPELLLKQRMAKTKPQVATFKGIKGVKELLYELLEAGGNEHHTFGSSEESTMMGDSWWISYHRKRAAMGIRAKLLFNESLREWAAEKKYQHAEIRYTKKGFEPLTETIIRNDRIGIILWTTPPIGILIHQELAAKSYDQFFAILWDAAASAKQPRGEKIRPSQK